MQKNIIVAGSGFAGTWAALAAARTASLAARPSELKITVISPTPHMHIRPRLYEAQLDGMAPELEPLFAAVGVAHLAGTIAAIDVVERRLGITSGAGEEMQMRYDRIVLATGSRLFTPAIPGLSTHAFNVDQLGSAVALAEHLAALGTRPATPARNTVVVAGGGFTGIEVAAEMPQRLRNVLGASANSRVIIVEQAPDIGPDLGPAPRPLIEEALAAGGVEVICSAGVVAIDADSVSLSNGTNIDTNTVVWTAGARANPLAAQIPGDHDRFGRVVTDAYLHAGVDGVFVSGDVAHAATDDRGNVAMMSCQHALSLGRVAGYNAAAELLDLPLHPYSQPKYVTCLDLGDWGAIFTEGWERQVVMTRAEAKATKREINTKWIYPPEPDRDAVFAVANPDFVIVP